MLADWSPSAAARNRCRSWATNRSIDICHPRAAEKGTGTASRQRVVAALFDLRTKAATVDSCAGSTRSFPGSFAPAMHPACSVAVLHHRVWRRLRARSLLDSAVRRAGRRAGRSMVRRRSGLDSSAGVTGGLLSSTAHLGHPERCVARLQPVEIIMAVARGVLATATYVPRISDGVGLGDRRVAGLEIRLYRRGAGHGVPADGAFDGHDLRAGLSVCVAQQQLTVPGYLCFALLSGLPGFRMRWRRSSLSNARSRAGGNRYALVFLLGLPSNASTGAASTPTRSGGDAGAGGLRQSRAKCACSIHRP